VLVSPFSLCQEYARRPRPVRCSSFLTKLSSKQVVTPRILMCAVITHGRMGLLTEAEVIFFVSALGALFPERREGRFMVLVFFVGFRSGSVRGWQPWPC
jgi:hypothetical protein